MYGKQAKFGKLTKAAKNFYLEAQKLPRIYDLRLDSNYVKSILSIISRKKLKKHFLLVSIPPLFYFNLFSSSMWIMKPRSAFKEVGPCCNEHLSANVNFLSETHLGGGHF